MPLFTIRPSRVTLTIFALIGGGLATRAGCNRHEATVIARDAPMIHTVRRLLRCVIGPGTERMLWPRPTDGDARPWARALNERLRALTAVEQGDQWPSRCVPLVRTVQTDVQRSSDTMRSATAAGRIGTLLDVMAQSRGNAIIVAENGALGDALATLTLQLLSSSVGTETGWQTPLAPAPTDLRDARLPRIPEGDALPPDADGATFAAPEWLFFQSTRDRRAHGILFREGVSPSDSVIGPGAPRAIPPNAAAMLLATDEADVLLPLEASQPTPIALPASMRDGSDPIDGWQSVRSGGHRWFAAVDRGTLRLWSTPLTGALAWRARVPEALSDAPIAAVALVPVPDATEAPSDGPAAVGSSAPGVIAYVLRHTANSLSVEEWPIPAPSADSTPSAAPAAGAAPAAPQTIDPRAPAAEHRVLTVAANPLSRPRVRTCVAGDSAHFLVAADDRFVFFHAKGHAGVSSETLTSRVGVPSEGRFDLSCDDTRALLLFDRGGSPSILLAEGALEPVALPLPMADLTVERSIDAVALVPNAVLAIVRTPNSIRALASDKGSSWRHLSLIASRREPGVGSMIEGTEGPAYTFSVRAASSYRDRVAILAVVRGGLSRTVRYASIDGGSTWR